MICCCFFVLAHVNSPVSAAISTSSVSMSIDRRCGDDAVNVKACMQLNMLIQRRSRTDTPEDPSGRYAIEGQISRESCMGQSKLRKYANRKLKVPGSLQGKVNSFFL